MFVQWIAPIISLIVIGFNTAMFIVIKFNDMKHLGTTITSLDKKFDCLEKKVVNTLERISTIEGKCSANHNK